MNIRETIQTLMDSIQPGDFETAKTLLSDDFQFSGPVPQPINKEDWLGMIAMGIWTRMSFPVVVTWLLTGIPFGAIMVQQMPALPPAAHACCCGG